MPKEEASLGITAKKSEDMSEWYQQAVQKAELADYTSVSGCMVFKPYAYAIWENIQKIFDAKIKKSGHKNAYFPLFIPEKLLVKEKKHVEGFTAEVAWVTHAGNTKLNERIAVRPTSETIINESYSKWIRSWRDLPMLLNQWCNVVRWEFEHPVPFLRTREFLWQEGHTAHASSEEAEKEVLTILEEYRDLMENYLAIPVITGRKTEKQKFAGADYTTTLEALMPNGKALQMGTSHFLGQNFAKAFGIEFLDKNEKKQHVWQTSWGISTRLIGALILAHGDDKGLVLPPKIAPVHIVIVPIIFEKTKDIVLKAANSLKENLSGYEVVLDDREGYSAGWKFNEWELKGVPLRIEIGPKDIEKGQVVLARRDTGRKEFVKMKEVEKKASDTLDDIQQNLFKNAKKLLNEGIVEAKTWSEFEKAIKQKKMVKALFCNDSKCEDLIKEKSEGATSRCLPFDQKNVKGKCVQCSKEAKAVGYWAKSY